MRDIKFRAWDKKEKKMYEVFSIDFDLQHLLCGQDVTLHFDEAVLVQYTGLKDKNGKEIYEGDIIKTVQGNFEVKWQDRTGQWLLWKDLTGWGYFQDRKFDIVFEVIGNVWENPNLLK